MKNNNRIKWDKKEEDSKLDICISPNNSSFFLNNNMMLYHSRLTRIKKEEKLMQMKIENKSISDK